MPADRRGKGTPVPPREPQPPTADAVMLDVRGVAGLYGISPRSVTRAVASGQIPPPIHLGHLRRWHKATLLAAVAAAQAAATIATAMTAAGRGDEHH